MQLPDLADEFIDSVNEGQIAQVLRYPGVVKKTISTKSTNADALREMLEQNIEALVVIDERRKLRGVVEREQVLSRMMLSLVR
jgi:predicted transcriptional regulator